jgi:hypothetical protein
LEGQSKKIKSNQKEEYGLKDGLRRVKPLLIEAEHLRNKFSRKINRKMFKDEKKES